MPDVQGRCPACSGPSLFLGEGGHVTCSRLDCPDPTAADDLLHGQEASLVQLLGGNRPAQAVAHTLHFHGHSLADVRRMTDEQLLAVPGIGETSLARIRRVLPAPSVADLIDAALDGAERPSEHGPVIGTASIALDVQATPHAGLDSLRQHAATAARKTDLDVTVEPDGLLYSLTVNRPDGMTRHGGYTAEVLHGMLLGIAAATEPNCKAAPDA